jgi:hypothetical protein
MTPAPPPVQPWPSPPRYPWLPVTRLRTGRVVLCVVLIAAVLVGGTAWLLLTQGRKFITPTVDSSSWPAWLQQQPTYPTSEPLVPKVAEVGPDPLAGINAKLAQILAEIQRQQAEIDALKKRPAGGTVINNPAQHVAKTPPAPKPHASMLFISHEVKDVPPKPSVLAYTLAPGATKLPCIVETSINSEVEGEFTAKVSTNVYDTATGRHVLVPQGSTILGRDKGQDLLYGNARLPTFSLTLALPDGRSVDLGQAPVTDQQGVTGLTGRVNQHWWRLFGAIFIGGALRGGVQAMQLAMADAAGAGQVAAGYSSVVNQALSPRVGRALDTRPTIEIDGGQICNVLLTKPLSLPAMWQ